MKTSIELKRNYFKLLNVCLTVVENLGDSMLKLKI